MYSFSIKPQIKKYETVSQMVSDFKLSESDLILTSGYLYDPILKPLNLNCPVLLRDKYGKGEPTDEMIDLVREDVRKMNVSRVIAIGGGAILDIAKFLVFDSDAKTVDFFTGKAKAEKVRQLIIAPTTCGTGSEVTNLSIAEIKSLNTKMGLALEQFLPDVAVLVPELLKTLSYKFFATSSIDALVHAVESYISPRANDYTRIFSEKAISMIINSYKYVTENGENSWFDKAEEFLVASNMAGIAFGNAGVGAVHALAYPLGGRYHIPHGQANQLMFMGVLKAYKAKKPVGTLNEIEKLIAKELNTSLEIALPELEKLLNKILKSEKLESFKIPNSELADFTKSVLETQKRLLANNYVELSENEILNIYQNAY